MGSSSNNKVDEDEIAVTDNSNYIVDLHFKANIKNVPQMAYDLKSLHGVVEQCIFSGMTSTIICAGVDGVVVKTPKVKDKILFKIAFASAATPSALFYEHALPINSPGSSTVRTVLCRLN